MSHIKQQGNIAYLPDSGTAIICSDLHGNFDDFSRIVHIFENTPNSYLIFLGDLIHGPIPGYSQYRFNYSDKSADIVEEVINLQMKHPNRVISLLGNHEHAHIGGAILDREIHHFDALSKDRLPAFVDFFNSLPLLILSSSGIVLMHGSPYISHQLTLQEIATLRYSGHDQYQLYEIAEKSVVGQFLWARYAPVDIAYDFLNSISTPSRKYTVVVSGHDPVEEGYEIITPNQLVLSSSYNTPQENKTYLKLDLGKSYTKSDELKELLHPLY